MSQPHSPTSIPQTNPYLTPQYLLRLSSHIQTLSTYYKQQQLGSISTQYKIFLQSTFKNLSNSLTIYQSDQNMIISSILQTKKQFQLFLGIYKINCQKLCNLLQKQTTSLSQIIRFILSGYSSNIQTYQQLLIRQKKSKQIIQNEKNESIINNLKKQIIIKRQYVKELQDRVKDLQQQNSKIYEKIINHAKNTINQTLIQTNKLTNHTEFMTPNKYNKTFSNYNNNQLNQTNQFNQTNLLTPINQINQNSPISLKLSHKQMSLKQVQQTILQILTLKKKQQSINQKRSSIKSYLKYYFKYKFGLSQLCQQIKINFLSAVRHFLSNSWSQQQQQDKYASQQNLNSQSQPQQRPLLLLFQKLLDEQIDEYYFWNQYIPKGYKIIKIFKRYLNQKQRIQIKYLDRLYDGYQGISGSISNYSSNKIILNQQQHKDIQMDQNDVRNILYNIYTKNKQIQTLQMIFSELLWKQPDNNWIGRQQNSIIKSRINRSTVNKTTVLSKNLLSVILCYQIELYAIKLNELTNKVRKYSSSSQYININYMGLEKIILQLNIQEYKYLSYLESHYNQFKDKEFTYSEVVEIIYGNILNQDKNTHKFNSNPNFNSKKS